MADWPRCTGCNSRLNSWRITLCHNCTRPVVAQPKTHPRLVESDEADRDASTSQPASDHPHLDLAERRASDGF
jgi:predicted amidophosphoribosyltransferase